MSAPKYRRVLLKISGELLAGQQGYGIEPAVLDAIADEIASVVAMDVEVAVVIGGGTSSAVLPPAPREWSAPRPITWACSPPS